MNVCTALNENYVYYAYVMLLSFFRSNQEDETTVYLLQYDLSEQSRRSLEQLCEQHHAKICFLDFNPEWVAKLLEKNSTWRCEIYMRLFLPELLPENVKRLLYLDADTIVMASLHSFYEQEFDGCDLICGRDLVMEPFTTEEYLDRRSEKLLFLFEEKRYFNSGVLLMNMEAIRGTCTFADYLDAAEYLDYQIEASPDQDLLNYVHRDKVKLVDAWSWNLIAWIAENHGYHYGQLGEAGKIIHYAGKKPWTGGDHVHYSLEKYWWDYALETPFAKELMERYIEQSLTDDFLLRSIGSFNEEMHRISEENQNLRIRLNESLETLAKVNEIMKKL